MVNLPVTKTSKGGILNTSLACVKYGVEISTIHTKGGFIV